MTVKSCSLDLLCIAGDGDADIHSHMPDMRFSHDMKDHNSLKVSCFVLNGTFPFKWQLNINNGALVLFAFY